MMKAFNFIIAILIAILGSVGFLVASFLYNIPQFLKDADQHYSSGEKSAGYILIALTALILALLLNGIFYVSARLKWFIFKYIGFDLPYEITDFIVCLVLTTFCLYFLRHIYLNNKKRASR